MNEIVSFPFTTRANTTTYIAGKTLAEQQFEALDLHEASPDQQLRVIADFALSQLHDTGEIPIITSSKMAQVASEVINLEPGAHTYQSILALGTAYDATHNQAMLETARSTLTSANIGSQDPALNRALNDPRLDSGELSFSDALVHYRQEEKINDYVGTL